MLLKITEACSMGCSHCVNDAKPDGEHMTLKVLEDGYNPEICDRDSMPLSEEQAHNVQAALSALVSHFSASLKEFHFKYDNSKPEPKYQVDAYFMEDKK